jgi:hypothetical protein
LESGKVAAIVVQQFVEVSFGIVIMETATDGELGDGMQIVDDGFGVVGDGGKLVPRSNIANHEYVVS